jgi:hypothetical protein
VADQNEVFSGYYSSRPDFKKSLRVASSEAHSQDKIFAQQVLRSNITQREVTEILAAKQNFMDIIDTMQSREAISGFQRELVVLENEQKEFKAMDASEKLYNRFIHERVMQETGINIKGKNGTGLSQCQEGQSGGNDTVLSCPISLANNNQKKEFLVLAHNPMGGLSQSYAKVKLPTKLYQA